LRFTAKYHCADRRNITCRFSANITLRFTAKYHSGNAVAIDGNGGNMVLFSYIIGGRMSKKKKIIIGVTTAVLAVAIIVGSALAYALSDKGYVWDGESLHPHEYGAIYDYRYYKESVKHDKAMILIPGLMASTFYNPETEEPMWGYPGIANLTINMLTAENKGEYFDFVVNSLKCDENNVPVMKERVAIMTDGDGYGSFDGMKYIYDMVQPVYGDRYDVVVWQYDWRQNNRGSAEELKKFIDYNGWKEVMFFTHSMGGVVVSNYLAMSAEHREKTKLFMPFGCPFLGSTDAINNLFESADSSGMMNMLFDAVGKYADRNFSLTEIARTLSSVYELLNFPAYDNSWYFDENNSEYYVGASGTFKSGGKFLTADEVYELICSFDWSKRADGSLMPAVKNLPKYREEFYVDDGNGGKIFVSDAVPTEYIVGIGVKTAISVEIDEEGKIISKITSDYGDGTVPAYSASAGHALDDPHVHLVYGVEHGPLANDNFQASKEESGLQYLMGILEKYID